MVGQAVEASTPFCQQSRPAMLRCGSAACTALKHLEPKTRTFGTCNLQLCVHVCVCACMPCHAMPGNCNGVTTHRGRASAWTLPAGRARGPCKAQVAGRPRRPAGWPAGQRRLGELPHKRALLLASCYTPCAPVAAGLIAWSMCVHTGSLHPTQLLRQTLNPHLRRLWPAALKQPWSQPAGQRRLD